MTDGLKNVRIRARNVTRVHGHRCLDDDASLVSLAPGKRRCRVLDAPCRAPVSIQPAHVWQWPLSKKIVATVCPLDFDTNSMQCDCINCDGINPVLGKNLEHLRLTR